jgi:hypothetical protein
MSKPAAAGSEYTCSACGGTFNRASDDAVAIKEAARNFGVKDASKDPRMVIVCDDCYHEMMVWLKR